MVDAKMVNVGFKWYYMMVSDGFTKSLKKWEKMIGFFGEQIQKSMFFLGKMAHIHRLDQGHVVHHGRTDPNEHGQQHITALGHATCRFRREFYKTPSQGA